jgi:hypothetical protein
MLLCLLDDAQQGAGNLVLVGGEAGVPDWPPCSILPL